jgi:alpha-galactosidase
VAVNEWCTSWGNPTDQGLVALARAVSRWKPRYLVIDAGWYKEGEAPWDRAHGDWKPSEQLFPKGLAATCAAIRAEGMVPGLWFELETAGSSSRVWSREELFLRRDGFLLQAGERRFFDFRLPAVHAYLEERVLGLIEECGIGYLKIDYNETTGWGADGNESEGEAIRQQVQGFLRFLARLRERFPELVVENCASGAMRADPLTVALCDQSSFSDAHETRDIPVIAANLQRLLPPRKTQVWAVLRDTDGERRLHYSLAATFLGRMCLSGDLMSLDAEARGIVDRAVALYREAAPIITGGLSRRQGPEQGPYRALRGWQAVLRRAASTPDTDRAASDTDRAAPKADRLLLVLHTFEGAASSISVGLPASGCRIVGLFAPKGLSLRIEGASLIADDVTDWCGAVALMETR